MDNKEFKRMSRRELVELIYMMKKKETDLQERVTDLEAKLEEKTIMISNAGSIAEAALTVNGFFQTAQASAEAYLLSAQKVKEEAEQCLAQAQMEKKKILENAEYEASEIIQKAKLEAIAIRQETEQEIPEGVPIAEFGIEESIQKAEQEMPEIIQESELAIAQSYKNLNRKQSKLYRKRRK